MKILIGYDGSESADAVFADLKKAGLPAQTEARIVSVGDLPATPIEVVGDLSVESVSKAHILLEQNLTRGKKLVMEIS